MELVKYEQARHALAECARVDEAKSIADKAQALAAYARQAKDTELEERAVEIRERAKIRLGELTLSHPRTNKDGPKAGTDSKVEELKEAGVSKSEYNRCEHLARKSDEEREAHIERKKEQVRARHNRERTHFSGAQSEEDERDNWRTPVLILEHVMHAMGDIDLDPCSDDDLSVCAQSHFTNEQNGLVQPWHGRVFCNPPYSQAEQWVDKFIAEDFVQGIILLPARPGSIWWQKLGSCLMCLVHGRLTFVGAEGPAPFPSAVFYRGQAEEHFIQEFLHIGDVWRHV